MNKSGFKIFFEYLMVTLGCFIMASGYVLFFINNRIAPGGITGLATILYYFVHFPVGIMVLIMNIPLLLLGVITLGKKLGVKTVFAMLVFSTALQILSGLAPITNDLMLAAIAGGALVGLGSGLIFRQGSTAGGSDLIARILHKIIPSVTLGNFLFSFDALVVIVSVFAFKNYELGLYAAVAIFVSSRVVDTVIFGVDRTKAVYIISEKSDLIAQSILHELNRGVTEISAVGKYTNRQRNILLSIMRPKFVVRVQQIVKILDPEAFVFVSDVKDVMGQGFQPYLPN
jgi:uncharacterized membrane-anchored protein YitT (DUF2179 family)